MMFDQQQKTCNGFSDVGNTENDDPSVSNKEIEVLVAEGSNNSSFPSKISQLSKLMVDDSSSMCNITCNE